ncbi:MAG TPA: starch-binding protein, partial [Candidatus Contendobacter sp.]|nr:starch-binding protein [Candidatus Contendobacter sp.]
MPDLVIHFQKPDYWADTVHIHYWDTRPAVPASAWPGVPMIAEADGWFVHRFTGIEAASLVFNDNQGCQTGDLWCEASGFYTNGQWHDSQAAAEASAAAAHRSPPPSQTLTASAHAPLDPAGPLGDFREETIYFLLTTRFYDGDPSNNFFCRDRIKFNRATGQPEDPHWRGDFKG